MIIRNLNRLNFSYFKNIIFKSYKVDGSINFGSKKANNFFLKKITMSNYYFEIGSGNSTLLAEKKNKFFYSIETSKSFYNFMLNKIYKKNKIKYFNLGFVGDFSYPIFINKKTAINYIKYIEKFFKFKKFPDFILVDGRYRVLFLLKLLKYKKKISSNKTCILLDDYKKRSNYKILSKFYNITSVGRMAKLVPKRNNIISFREEINNYLYDPR